MGPTRGKEEEEFIASKVEQALVMDLMPGLTQLDLGDSRDKRVALSLCGYYMQHHIQEPTVQSHREGSRWVYTVTSPAGEPVDIESF